MNLSTTAWMIAGSTDPESLDVRRQHEQRRALRESAGTADGPAAVALRSLRAVVARWTDRTDPAPGGAAMGCCAA